MNKLIPVTVMFCLTSMLLSACSRSPAEVTPVASPVIDATVAVEPTEATETDASAPTRFEIPVREGPRTITSGTVPHVQLDVIPNQAVNEELFRRAFTLPGVEDRPTIVSLPGARGMWLAEDIALAHPMAIVSGREFAHIHPDGSLHAPLPFTRAVEISEKGWGERHPWADDREGWEGFVMLYTPVTEEELEITFQLIVESYNHVTGQNLQAANYP